MLNEMEGAFYAFGAIGVAALMRHEPEPETLREGVHLRHRNHLAPRAAQHDHVRVVDHDSFRRAGGSRASAAPVAFRIEL